MCDVSLCLRSHFTDTPSLQFNNINSIQTGASLVDAVTIVRSVSDVSSDVKAIQQLHKKTLKKQTEKLVVKTILIKEKVKQFQLVVRYTELTIISDVRDRDLVEHELLARGREHEEWRQKQLRGELEKIRIDKLFHSSFSGGGPISWLKKFFKRRGSGNFTGTSAVVSGVAGIGKTTMVQKIVHDWATGKIYPHFHFVFIFKFRDLNRLNCRITLNRLITEQYPYLRGDLDELWKHPERLLFIFDGLDEFRGSIDFADIRRDTEPQRRCTHPEFRCKLSDIVYSLIQKKLLPGCSVLVTSRPLHYIYWQRHRSVSGLKSWDLWVKRKGNIFTSYLKIRRWQLLFTATWRKMSSCSPCASTRPIAGSSLCLWDPSSHGNTATNSESPRQSHNSSPIIFTTF
uniref:NACHT domain-containing protein n=1 Tax=Callorhinchus milii TaxID=7868 RepID=A0A4W3HE94_CALMI